MEHVAATAVSPLLLRPEEAAHALRVGRSKVYDLIRTGELQSVKVGGSRRVPMAALAAYVASLVAAEAEVA